MKAAKIATIIFLSAGLLTVPAHADHAVNINTADKATLITLTGIGEVKAQAIIDYRSTTPFTKIEDIMDVSGIGTATFNGIKDHITVSGSTPPTVTETPPPQTQTQTQTSPPPQGAAGGVGPPAITLEIDADTVVTAGGGSYFEAHAFGTQGVPLPGTRFIWNFGDGVVAEGPKVLHAYAYPGRYALVLTAAYNYSSAIERLIVEATPAQVSLVAEGDGALLIRNHAARELDIGHWSLVDGSVYLIPEDTRILAGEGVRFATAVTKLSGSMSAALLYPNGAIAASAQAGATSALRGERVPVAALTHYTAPLVGAAIVEEDVPALSTEAPPEELSGAQSAAVAASGSASAWWMSLSALGVLLAAGAAGVQYLRPRSLRAEETSPPAEEFDIVD